MLGEVSLSSNKVKCDIEHKVENPDFDEEPQDLNELEDNGIGGVQIVDFAVQEPLHVEEEGEQEAY